MWKINKCNSRSGHQFSVKHFTVRTFSRYSPATLHISPATGILNENPA